jgi:hypothetical protein
MVNFLVNFCRLMVNFRLQLLTLKDSNQINSVVNFRFRSNEDSKCLHLSVPRGPPSCSMNST